MTTNDLYNNILNSRWYVAEHATILLQFDEDGDPTFDEQLNRVMDIILNTRLLENHYTTIMQSGSSTLLSEEEMILLTARNTQLCLLPVKTP